MKNILLDTDVILDFFFDRKPYSESAEIILSLCDSGKLNAFITPVIVSNTYYLLRQTASHQKVINSLSRLMSLTEILNINKNVILQALESDFRDFEDALQNYSAESHGKIDVIITRNIKDYKYSAIGVMTPVSFLKMVL